MLSTELKREYQSILPWQSPKLITFSLVTKMDIKDFPAISNLLIIDLYIDTTYAAFVFGQLSFGFCLQYLMIGLSSIHMLQVNFCLLTFSTLL